MSTRTLRSVLFIFLALSLMLMVAPVTADGTGDTGGGDPTPGSTIPSAPAPGAKALETAPCVMPPIPIPTQVSIALARLTNILL